MLLECFFFFNDTATTEIYTLSLHDALPISGGRCVRRGGQPGHRGGHRPLRPAAGRPRRADRRGGARRLHRDAAPRGGGRDRARSEEHTSELQSRQYLVCRLLLEKKKL